MKLKYAYSLEDKSVNSRGGSSSGGCSGGRAGCHCLPAHHFPFGAPSPRWEVRPLIKAHSLSKCSNPSLFNLAGEIQFFFPFTILNALFFFFASLNFLCLPKYRAKSAFLEAEGLAWVLLVTNPRTDLSGGTSSQWPASFTPHSACHPQLVLECAQKSLHSQLSQTPGNDFFKLVT